MTSTHFTHQKRLFLLSKLDDVIKLWASGSSGQGTFHFIVSDGIPSLQCNFNLAMEDIDPVHHHHTQQHDPVRRHRRRGPARQARDRLRAAKHQSTIAAAVVPAAPPAPTASPPPAAPPAPAALAPAFSGPAARLAPAAPTPAFSGLGKVVGTAHQPVLPLPLNKGDVFPPPSTVSSTTVVSSPPSSTSSSTSTACSSSQSQPGHLAVPVKCTNEILSDSDDETEDELYLCGQCLTDIDGNSASYYCQLCVKTFHTQCITGQKCSYN